MSIRAKFLGFVDVIMRIPPLFLLDEILKMNLFETSPSHFNNLVAEINETINSNLTTNLTDTTISSLDLYVISLTLLKCVVFLIGCFSSVAIFMLWTRHLVIVYMYIISVGLIFLSYWSNLSAIALIKDGPSLLEDILNVNIPRLTAPDGTAVSLLPHFMLQWVMGTIFTYIHLGPKHNWTQKAIPFAFLMPLCLATLPIPLKIVKHAPTFAAVLPLVLAKIAIWSASFDIFKTLISGYRHAVSFAENFGLSALVENEWQRLNVPCVLRAFWTIRLIEQFATMTFESQESLTFMFTIQKLLVTGCETLIALLGMTSIISIICHYIGKLFQMFLMSEEDEDKSIGTVSAILFYILSLQTGLTTLQPDKRFIRLCRNMCLLVTALLHFLHNMVSPILMSLSASHNPSRKRHTRALLVCLFLLSAPILLLITLWSRHQPSTWLLAVTVFSIEVVVKVLVSLATYILFLLDARRQTFWERLDDYIYYIKAFGNSVEFCFGIFLFFNGAWILIFESGSLIRGVMLIVHSYFNIWCEAKAGWSVYIKRRTAVQKISSLSEASTAELQNFDDVCAICYQEMSSAKITRCKHYFHGVCLRKWLYVQDKCPLCHEIVINQDLKAEIIKVNDDAQVDEQHHQQQVPNLEHLMQNPRRVTPSRTVHLHHHNRGRSESDSRESSHSSSSSNLTNYIDPETTTTSRSSQGRMMAGN
ncbi:CLUMA_CG003953, isoform C [Clunio marinus]|uniref:CLUMA_CG003953, isoform C n=1 Tax=Clunio marinus TaxID=568069 RepID=A0A1J1HVR2_9DIPT|nr:CLUMA_CG003953, isoform C [Clunio marinus]